MSSATAVAAPDGDFGRKSWSARAPDVLSYALLLGGIATIAVCAYMMVVTYSSLPYWDGWTQIEILAGGGNDLSPAWLWQQHNEHRLVLPKLFLAVDTHLFHARQAFLLVSIFIVQLLHLLLWGWSMRVLGGWRGAPWRAGFGLFAFCLFCPSQSENLIWGFQICYVLPGLFATLSIVGLMLYWTHSQQSNRGSPEKYLWLSILAAIASSYSLSNGNLLWPLLIATALLLRMRRSAVLRLTLAGVVSTSLYLYGYVRPWYHADPLLSLQRPLALLRYMAVYLGSSWALSHAWPLEVAIFAGLTFALITLWRRRPAASISGPFAVQLLLVALFCLATAFITAAGRLNLGFNQAVTSRYQTFALMFWCCLGVLLLAAVISLRPRQPAFLVLEVCFLIIMARGAGLVHRPFEGARLLSFSLHAGAAAILTDVLDETQLANVNASVFDVVHSVPYMRHHRLSVFAGPFPSELGKPLDSVYTEARSTLCTGALQSTVAVDTRGERGLRITGWAWDGEHRRPPERIIATTNGAITGVAAVGDLPPSDVAANPELKGSYPGFLGYVRYPLAFDRVELYAVLSNHPPTACYFASVPVP